MCIYIYTGLWYTYPSEKYEWKSVGMIIIPFPFFFGTLKIPWFQSPPTSIKIFWSNIQRTNISYHGAAKRAIKIYGSNFRKTPRISETTKFRCPFRREVVAWHRKFLKFYPFLMKKTQESYEKPLKSAPFLPGGSWDIYGPKKMSVFASSGRYPDQQGKLWRSSRPPHKMRPPPREHWWVNTSELFLGGTLVFSVSSGCVWERGTPVFTTLWLFNIAMENPS